MADKNTKAPAPSLADLLGALNAESGTKTAHVPFLSCKELAESGETFRFESIRLEENKRFKKEEVRFTLILASGEKGIVSLYPTGQRRFMAENEKSFVSAGGQCRLVAIENETTGRVTYGFEGV